jgi:hypothetical protein
MKLANTTNFPDEKIREIIQFVKPNNLPSSVFDVTIKNGGGSGYFRPSADLLIDTKFRSDRPIVCPKRTQIYATINNHDKFPFNRSDAENGETRKVTLYYDKYNTKKEKWEKWHVWHFVGISKAYLRRKGIKSQNRFGASIKCLLLDQTEELVETLAHEFRHYWQSNHKTKRGKVKGSRGQYSEKDADSYAIRKVREWRKLHAVDIYNEQPDLIGGVR